MSTARLKHLLISGGLFWGTIFFVGMILIDAFVNSAYDGFPQSLGRNIYYSLTEHYIRKPLISYAVGILFTALVDRYHKRGDSLKA